MGDTPFTDKAWDAIPHNVPAFGIALGMRAACEKMERQRNELLGALEAIIKSDDEAEGYLREIGIPPEEPMEIFTNARAAIAKAKGEAP